jgi:hypothetical protein
LALSWPSLGKIVSFPVLDGDYRHDENMVRLSSVLNSHPLSPDVRKEIAADMAPTAV